MPRSIVHRSARDRVATLARCASFAAHAMYDDAAATFAVVTLAEIIDDVRAIVLLDGHTLDGHANGVAILNALDALAALIDSDACVVADVRAAASTLLFHAEVCPPKRAR